MATPSDTRDDTRDDTRAHPLGLTPSQTVGPYLAIGLSWDDGEAAVDPAAAGVVHIVGRLFDGAGDVIVDGMIETWQADSNGRFDHPDDPRGAAPRPRGQRGFARVQTLDGGRWSLTTVRPGPVPGPGGTVQAPHLDVSVFARGLLDRVVTRIYFPEDATVTGPGGHAEDPVLQAVPAHRRSTLVALPVDGGYVFDIHLQGEAETVFFDV